MKGVVIQQLGPVAYTVEVDGKLLKRHLQWIEPSSPDSLPTDNTIQDNFSYPESSLGTPDETNSEEPALEKPFSCYYPHRDWRPIDRLTLWTTCFSFKEEGNVATGLLLICFILYHLSVVEVG